MPSDTLGLTVGTGLGVSVLAGILSGVCFIIGYRSRIGRKRNRKWHCNVCGEYLRSAGFVLRNGQFVYCAKCNTKVCRSACSVEEADGSWVCNLCAPKVNSWIDGAFKVVEPFTKALLSRMSLMGEPPDELEEYLEEERNREKEQLRDFIERLVNDILGENVDDASINKIYDDSNYLPLVGESPCSAHTALKVIIQKIIREASQLPKLNGEGTTNALEQNNRTYEDLLSTAILNKIISTSQSNLHTETGSSSRTNSVYSHRSSSSRRRAQKEYFFGEETLDHKWKNVDTDTASISSLEEWVHSDSSLGSTKYVDKVSLTIKQRIEEVSSSDSEREDERLDEAEYFRSNSAFSNEEPNWFLQKRQFRGGTSSPVPVPMLVPDPTTEAKVLIGDREVEDTSDLSDVPSDFEHDPADQVSLMDVKNHLIETKCLIGGKNPLVDLSVARLSDDEVSADSGVKECKDLDEADPEALTAGRKHENEVAPSICSDGSTAERDTEYTEKYATLPRTILLPLESSRSVKNGNNENNKPGLGDKEQTNGIEEESNEENPIEFTGVYSQREKEKWKNAVELKNNPYSKENIERRIKSRNSINSLFGSDYYIRQARLPSGAKKSEVANSDSKSEEDVPSNQEEEEELIYEDCQEDEPVVDSFAAKKIFLDESNPASLEKTTNGFNSLETNSSERFDSEIVLSSEITSDSEASLVNCYDVTQSVVYKKLSKDDNEEIQTAEQFFGFESLDACSNHEEVDCVEELSVKPVAKPRRNVNSIPNTEIKMQTFEEGAEEKQRCKESDDGFDAVPYVINKRSDNTLIRKIYSDPSVRSFALNNRNKLPISVDDTFKNKKPPSPPRTSPEKSNTKPLKTESRKIAEFPKKPEEAKVSSEWEAKYADIDCFYARANAVTKDSKSDGDEKEIIELKEQKLVSSRLKEFSKSSINLSRISDESLDQGFSSGLNKNRAASVEIDGTEREPQYQRGERSTSVKDLRKKFEQFDAKAKSEKAILYSLTGRSISKQFKERLREIGDDSLTLSQVHSLSLTNLEVEENSR
ncbi:uncharacterized protein LOC123310669 isoform X2 [Coccinella septempunctata]|uniref:uncharacterized protein LOC123310669 isoform X2 n=1 Tax=Coccinella septempunctata TaxID=41139 RepID=UPI001D0691B7|nr:uncharacterized protein LOC123310669 isoform X2 [Coccinella septempunctata]